MKINTLLDELDDLIENRKHIILKNIINYYEKNKNSITDFELSIFYTNQLSDIKRDIYLKLNDIKNYNPEGKEDYEKIAKIIAHTHDIVEYNVDKILDFSTELLIETSIIKLPKYIKKYFRSFENFKDIKEIETEGPYKFDGKGSYLNYQNFTMGQTYVQATKTKDILSQTELIFKTSEEEESKKIYVIQESYPKNEIETYFNINDSELEENLEVLKFLMLSSKIYENKVLNKNKTLEYFFSIIFFSSKGFENQYNKDMYKIYYEGDFDLLNLLENKTKKNNSEYIIIEIQKYLEKIFRYFNKALKMESFENDCYISEPMEEILQYLTNLTNNHLKDNKERNLLKGKIEKIEINRRIINKTPNQTRKESIIYKIKKIFTQDSMIKDLNFLYADIQLNKIINHSFDYESFAEELQKIYIEECDLEKIKYSNEFIGFKDEDILNLVFYNFGNNFINLSYEYKKKKSSLKNGAKDINYDEIKKFKKFLIHQVIKIFNDFNLEHIKVLNKIFANTQFSTIGLKYILLDACFDIANKTANVDYINNFKIYLLSNIFYPETLNNENYPKITEHILKYSASYNICSTDLIDKFISCYKKYKAYTTAVEFINLFDFSTYDLYNILNILEKRNEYSQLQKYIKFKMQELLTDGRALLMQAKLVKNRSYKQYTLVRKYPTEEILSNQFYKNIHQDLIELNLILFTIMENNKTIAVIVGSVNQEQNKYNVEWINENYTHEQISEICNLIMANQ